MEKSRIRLYVAPMEGLTGYVYRNAHHTCFPEADCYMMPFADAHQTHALKTREKMDLLPAHNEGIPVIPQILAKKAEDFVWLARLMREMGYREVNLNLGCPSPTVVTHGKGSGFLADPDGLDRFFEGIFDLLREEDIVISVKTRVGMENAEEAEGLLKIYNRYPIDKLFVHARVGRQMYRGQADLDAFAVFAEGSSHPVVYNGDVFTVSDMTRILSGFPSIEGIMCGRGLIRNPALFREMKACLHADADSASERSVCGIQVQGAKAESDSGPAACIGTDTADTGLGVRPASDRITAEELHRFHNRLLRELSETLPGGISLISHMKEYWFYMASLFEGADPYLKKIRKARDISAYRIAAEALFANCQVLAEDGDVAFRAK